MELMKTSNVSDQCLQKATWTHPVRSCPVSPVFSLKMRADMSALPKRGSLQTFGVGNVRGCKVYKYMCLLHLQQKTKTTRKVFNVFGKTNANKGLTIVKQLLNVQAYAGNRLPILSSLGPSQRHTQKRRHCGAQRVNFLEKNLRPSGQNKKKQKS